MCTSEIVMNYILKKQSQFLKILAENQPDAMHNPSTYIYLTNGDVVEYIKNHAYYLNEEINELILAIGGEDRAILKPWSSRHAAIAEKFFESTDKVKEEAIDMLCFCMNICLAVGLTPENVYEEYIKKWQENCDRQKRGY